MKRRLSIGIKIGTACVLYYSIINMLQLTEPSISSHRLRIVSRVVSITEYRLHRKHFFKLNCNSEADASD